MAPSPRRLLPGALNVTGCIVANCAGICWYDECIEPPPAPPPDTITIAVRHKSSLLSSFLVAAASLLALSFLLLLIFYSLLRLRRRNRRRLLLAQQQQQQQLQALPPPHADDLLFLDDDDQGDGGPHHVWFIRTVGLDESVIKSIAAVVYKSGDGLIGGGDCAVCLGEFRDGEVVKLLPKCSHAFHLSCIDTWLRSHVNCPLCRAPVVAPSAAGPLKEEDDSGSESAQIEISMSQPNQDDRAMAMDMTAGSSSSSSGPPAAEEEDEVQSVRRSVSLDATSLARLMMRADFESEAKLGNERKEIELREVVISKNKGKGVDCSGKQQPAVEIKRSLSSLSGRFFFPRYGRGRSASVLPL